MAAQMTEAPLDQFAPDNPCDGGQCAADERISFAIIGGGISGLALAVWMKRAGANVCLFDKSRVPGGVIGTVRKGGFAFERGPNTILDKSPAFDELCEITGLQAEIQRAPMKGQERYIWHGGKLHPVPTGLGALISTRLVTLRGKLRALKEFNLPPVVEDEPLRTMICRRLGEELYDRAFVPMVQGIWAGDPEQMSAAASFPLLKELERQSGGLIRGLLAKAKSGRSATREPRKSINLVSICGGLDRLPNALAAYLAEGYHPEVEIARVSESADPEGYRIEGIERGQRKTWRAEQVAVCADAAASAEMIEPIAPLLSEKLRAVHYSPIIAIGLGVERGSLRIPPGFGFLAARGQGLRLLGAIFNSNFLPDRAPDGCAALTIMLGGDLDPGAMNLTDDQIVTILRNDLKAALRWNGQFRTIHIERWARAIPRYGMAYFSLQDTIAETEAAHSGLRFFANWRGGVSIGDRIALAKELSESLLGATARTSV